MRDPDVFLTLPVRNGSGSASHPGGPITQVPRTIPSLASSSLRLSSPHHPLPAMDPSPRCPFTSSTLSVVIGVVAARGAISRGWDASR
ncbi:hypothetical protein HMPREF9594_00648 [Cutibacterium acnes HL005PA1]|nr:hypothetical protein HMPREF9594_00648 [Cutibacterium acnes HL005PA1]EGE93250.1 hypothetical protein HMPREF9571_01162 [Cutibacterium acnes HL043PA2]